MKFEGLLKIIKEADGHFKKKAAGSINKYLSLRNWLIGGYIFEFEQRGQERASYGSNLLLKLSEKLDTDGFSERNLKLFRQFYLNFPEIRQTLSAEMDTLPEIGQTASAESKTDNIQIDPQLLLDHLSFSHFIELARLENQHKRNFYALECLKGTWSLRQLKRQISSLMYERAGMSQSPGKVSELAQATNIKPRPEDLIKNPFVVEFLGLPQKEAVRESDLEKALLDHLQEFLLELGHGFCFEARQKRILIGTEYFFIDLVFYHRILKCHVLIDLKVEEFTHTNAGQLNTYLNYYRKNMMADDDHPPTGMLLCTDKNEALVEYATGGMDKNLFVSEYKVELPSEKELKRWLERDIEISKNNLTDPSGNE